MDEQSDSYKELVHPSVYVRFKLFEASKNLKKALGYKKAYFLVWTTTPWTLPANVAVAVNQTLKYLVVKDKKTEQLFIVGETAFSKLKYFKNFEKVAKLSGKDLEGSKLASLTESFVPKQEGLEVPVIGADFVSDSDGTGLVHIAPGCGLDDFELGIKLGLPFLAPLNEDGTYLNEFGFDGQSHLDVSKLVLKKLSTEGSLFKQSSLKHRYPVCWRCGHELVFRLVDEWFIKTDEIRPKLLDVVEQVTWHPYYMKDQMKNWLTNMSDWCISRKRFWGLPLPFFECSCGHLTVVSRLQELYTLAGFDTEEEFRKVIPDLHRPYVDNLEITCSNCGENVKRVLSVGDCWLDAGVVPFSTLNYLENHDYASLWNKWFPADFVVEMREQIRLWFYSMLFMSVTLTGKAPYKNVMAYEKVLDEKGEAMHRSKGNAIWWSETAEKVGADANRLFYTSWDPTKSLLYGYNNLKKSLNTFNTFWSCCRFFQQNISLSPNYWTNLHEPLSTLSVKSHLDQWFLVNLRKTHKRVHESYQAFKIEEVRSTVDMFWQKVSTFWLRNRRNQFWAYEEDTENTDNLVVYQLLWHAILASLFWLAPIAPHVTEYLFQTLVRPFTQDFKESLHLNQFHEPDFTGLDYFSSIEEEVNDVEKVLELSRNVRQMAKIKLRYTLPEIYLHHTDKEKVQMLQESWLQVLLSEINVKRVVFDKYSPSIEESARTSKFGFEVALPIHVSDSLKLDWLHSDVFRTVQFLRKNANLAPNQIADVVFEYQDYEVDEFLTPDFLNKLKTEAFVELRNLKPDNPQQNDGSENWFSKEVKFDNKRITILLKGLLNR